MNKVMANGLLVLCAGAQLAFLLFSYQAREEILNPSPPDFAQIENIAERKEVFLGYMGQLAQRENGIIEMDRQKVQRLESFRMQAELGNNARKLLARLSEKYGVDEELSEGEQLAQLLRRVDTVPVALVQVQAAVESGWGTSRFAREANNFFGQWCFEVGCGVVPSKRQEGKMHEIASFDHPKESVRAYLMNLNTFYAYKDLRGLRQSLRAKGEPLSAQSLLPGLLSYSERGQAYIDQLQGMIVANKLEIRVHQSN